MDIERKAYRKLLEWKNSSDESKAILIKGARRVGKTYLAQKFAKAEYESYIIIDFSNPVRGTDRIFKKYGNSAGLNEFFNQLSVLYSTPLYSKKSVIIFDEVQKYPNARELIKLLVADNRYDFIETGMLTSIKQNTKGIVIPSEEDELILRPLDFEEFLNALDDFSTIPFLRESYESKKPLGTLLESVNEKLRLYMMIGGMPQVVSNYAENANYAFSEKIKRVILKLYKEDIAKYAASYAPETNAIFKAIPNQLSHHDKKIKYSSLNEGDRFSSYRNALAWISDSMIGSFCYGLDDPTKFDGFSFQENKIKCYMSDTGLLLTLTAGENYLKSDFYKSFMLGNLSINKNMMTENLVAQMLSANHHPLRFYETIIKTGGQKKKYEVDFLIQKNGETTPIEINSGNSKSHASLDYFTQFYKKKSNKGIVFTKGDFRETDNYIFLPFAMAMFL